MMLKKTKLNIVVLFMIGLASMTFTTKVSAQSCTDNFYYARDAYYNGDYGAVHRYLAVCIQDFDRNPQKWKGSKNGIDWVFIVYKLIGATFYQTNEQYRADEMFTRLRNYMDFMRHESVVDKYNRTNF